MSDQRQQLETTLQLLACGSSEVDDRIADRIRKHCDMGKEVLRQEIHALRLFSVESGIDLACGEREDTRDQFSAALYSPMVKAARDADDANLSMEFATLKARVEVYRGSLQDCEQAMITPQDLVQRVGQQFAKLCGAPETDVEEIGLSIFVDTCRRAKRVAESIGQQRPKP